MCLWPSDSSSTAINKHIIHSMELFHFIFCFNQIDSFALLWVVSYTQQILLFLTKLLSKNSSGDSISTMSNSEHNIITGHAGYVLEDVPHLSDYIPHLTVTSSSPNASLLFAKNTLWTKKDTTLCCFLYEFVYIYMYIFHWLQTCSDLWFFFVVVDHADIS